MKLKTHLITCHCEGAKATEAISKTRLLRLRLAMTLIAFVLVMSITLSAEEIALTLDEAIAIALRDNRDILLKAEEVKKAKEEIAEAKAGLLPTLNFSGTWSDTRGYYAKDLAQASTQLTLKQYLYKGSKTINSIGQKKYELEVSNALLDKAKLETVLNVQQAFYTLLLAAEFNNLNKDIMDNTQAHLEVINSRYQRGEVSQSEVLKIKEALGNVQEAYEASLNQIESGATLLKNLLYLDDKIRIIAGGEFVYVPRAVAYSEGFLEAMERRPELRQYAAQEQADRKAIEVEKSSARPNIYASWDYYSRSTTSLTFSPNKAWQDYNIVGLTFSWPIFDGWATKAKVAQAVIDLSETRLLKEKTVKDIALELKNSYLALKNAIAKIKATEAQKNLYEDRLSVMQAQYKAGIVSSLDLDDASLGYRVSLFEQRQAIYDYLVAEAQFDKATGGI